LVWQQWFEKSRSFTSPKRIVAQFHFKAAFRFRGALPLLFQMAVDTPRDPAQWF
jgi:hypothetical protein